MYSPPPQAPSNFFPENSEPQRATRYSIFFGAEFLKRKGTPGPIFLENSEGMPEPLLLGPARCHYWTDRRHSVWFDRCRECRVIVRHAAYIGGGPFARLRQATAAIAVTTSYPEHQGAVVVSMEAATANETTQQTTITE